MRKWRAKENQNHAVRRMFQNTTKIIFVDKRFWYPVNRVSNCELKKSLIVHAFGSNHLDQPYQGFCTKVTVLIIDVIWMRDQGRNSET